MRRALHRFRAAPVRSREKSSAIPTKARVSTRAYTVRPRSESTVIRCRGRACQPEPSERHLQAKTKEP